jgi:hypothetical protein
MTCRHVALPDGVCRIEVEEGAEPPRFTAHMLIVGRDGRARPVVFDNGRVAEIHATSEALAINAAMTYLEDRLRARRRV